MTFLSFPQLYSEIGTVSDNVSNVLQYIHSSTDIFDFNDPETSPGYHRLLNEASYKNAPSGLKANHCNVEVVRSKNSDTLAMVIYPYDLYGTSVWYKSGSKTEWAGLSWNVYVTKTDLNNTIRLIGNAANFKVRTGGNGIKNIYLDIVDSSGSMTSIGFISDTEKAIQFSIDNTIMWKLPIS